MASDNPIAARLARLDAQWTAFIDDADARQLHWLIEPDEWRMLDLYFTVEDTQDAFFVVDVPFKDSATHGVQLRTWLVDKYREVEPQLAEAGAETGWQPPRVGRDEDDIDVFVSAAHSLWEHHQPLFEHLVAVLVPETIVSAAAWTGWLDRLLPRCPEPLRFVLVDYAQSPALARLALEHAGTVRTVTAGLDMEGAYVDLSADAGGLDEPPGMFRHAFVQMSNAISEGDMKTAESQANAAKSVAGSQGWTHLAFAVDFARGSGYLGQGDAPTAIGCYRTAEESAASAHAAGEDFGLGLVLKARLGQGAACIAAEAYDRGASVYEGAAPLARETEDKRTELDCLRMAAYCHEQSSKFTDAWARGIEALTLAESMDAEERESSTLAHAGTGLLRVCKTRGFAGRETAVDARMTSLLGRDWRPA